MYTKSVSAFSTFPDLLDQSLMSFWIRHPNDKGKHHYHFLPCYYELILFKLPFNSQLIFTEIFVTSPEIASRPPVSIYNAVSSWNRESWTSAGFCPWQKKDFYQRSGPYLHHVRCFLCFIGELNHFSVRFRPLWHPCHHSPWDYAQVPNIWLIIVGYLPIV